jgi:hypothetical protein
MHTALRLSVLTSIAALATADAHAQAVVVSEIGNHTSEVTVVLAAPAHDIYQLVTDYANWPLLFSDVEFAQHKSGGRENARVRFRSRILDMPVTVDFDNIPDRAVRFVGRKGPPGGKAHGEYLFEPIGDGSRTRVTARLYLNVTGPAGWFVRDKTIRKMRRAKLAADMNDAIRWLTVSRASS